MKRGFFDFFSRIPHYRNAEKTWLVTLDSYDLAWLGFMLPGYEAEREHHSLLRTYLRDMKKRVDESLEKRFIYFICSKKKTRFKPVVECVMRWDDACAEIPFHLGGNRRECILTIKRNRLLNADGERPAAFTTDEDAITLRYPSGRSNVFPVASFLNDLRLDFC